MTISIQPATITRSGYNPPAALVTAPRPGLQALVVPVVRTGQLPVCTYKTALKDQVTALQSMRLQTDQPTKVSCPAHADAKAQGAGFVVLLVGHGLDPNPGRKRLNLEVTLDLETQSTDAAGQVDNLSATIAQIQKALDEMPPEELNNCFVGF